MKEGEIFLINLLFAKYLVEFSFEIDSYENKDLMELN
jgi:hypothetical protein